MNNNAILLQGFALFVEFLLDAEADFLCSATRYERSENRLNYRSGCHDRKLRTELGDVKITVPHLRYIPVRVSMVKRAQRLHLVCLNGLADIYTQGTTSDRIAVLIKAVWTADLPDGLLADLTTKLIAQLDAWRATSTGVQPGFGGPAAISQASAPAARILQSNEQPPSVAAVPNVLAGPDIDDMSGLI